MSKGGGAINGGTTAEALRVLMRLQTRVDPLLTELLNSLREGEGGRADTTVGALSAVLGYAAALGVQWVGKSVATLLVAAAALLQFLHHKRVVRVSWSGIGKRFAWLLDFDRDGKLGVGDVKVAARKAGGVLGVTRVPSGAAFVLGLAFGLGVLPPKF